MAAADIGLALGIIAGLCGLVGVLSGGFLSDRLTRRETINCGTNQSAAVRSARCRRNAGNWSSFVIPSRTIVTRCDGETMIYCP